MECKDWAYYTVEFPANINRLWGFNGQGGLIYCSGACQRTPTFTHLCIQTHLCVQNDLPFLHFSLFLFTLSPVALPRSLSLPFITSHLFGSILRSPSSLFLPFSSFPLFLSPSFLTYALLPFGTFCLPNTHALYIKYFIFYAIFLLYHVYV